jgi:hypothetical protein
LQLINDETLPKFIKRKHPRKGKKNNKKARTKVHANKQRKRGKGTIKYQNLHQLLEAYY